MTQKFRDNYGVEVLHAWGMTEMSPLGTVCSMKPEVAGLADEAWLDVKVKQGHAPFGVEMKITDDDGKPGAVGRQDLRQAEGARAGDRARLLQGRSATRSTRKASSTPATSPPSTATATCRSPTAPRT